VNRYLSLDNNDSETGLRRHYVNAVETRNRVASPFLTEVMCHLEKLMKYIQRLKAVLEVDLIEHTTSVPGQIHISMNSIIQQTHNSLVEFSSQIVDKFSDYYDQNIDILVTRLVESAKSLLCQKSYVLCIDVNDEDSFDIDHILKIGVDVNAFCKDLKSLVYEVSNNNREANFSSKLFDNRCSHFRHHLRFWNGMCWVRLHYRKPTNVTFYIHRLVQIYQNRSEIAQDALRCVLVYGTFLNEVKTWLKDVLTMNSSLPLKTADRRQVSRELQQESNWLVALSGTFAEKSMVILFFIKKFCSNNCVNHFGKRHVATQNMKPKPVHCGNFVSLQ